MAVVDGTNAGFVLASPTDDPAASSGAIDTYAITSGKFTSPSDAVRIIEMGWWQSNAVGNGTDFDIGVYDDDGSANNRLYVQTSQINTANGWQKVTGLNWSISGSTIYWFGLQVDGTTPDTGVDYSTHATYGREYKSNTSLPAVWDGGSFVTRIIALYAVYETASGSAIKSVVGLAKASVKSVNGLAIASVKTINGLA